ncbi:hypothetical protein IE81DRAFT_233104 [Ceraceosorus guamensis]|uniref:Uncharacterized protein n=1 Tax=Ceraceosorus guamensis TaxID=1522189 RepID=A0A316VSK0_9BASI|nr:hypothetical protein IE81DRAFT_233104 [Ceraceosorus guamensis]PWN40340.1 hypothetical protein IE81DRAFT_233104 [Ceraceosorus guamensis]
MRLSGVRGAGERESTLTGIARLLTIGRAIDCPFERLLMLLLISSHNAFHVRSPRIHPVSKAGGLARPRNRLWLTSCYSAAHAENREAEDSRAIATNLSLSAKHAPTFAKQKSSNLLTRAPAPRVFASLCLPVSDQSRHKTGPANSVRDGWCP